jgi:hypothetical protein
MEKETHFLKFNCYQFSRGVEAGRPLYRSLARRWVSADKCLCTDDSANICDRGVLYGLLFGEDISDEERAKYQKKDEERAKMWDEVRAKYQVQFEKGPEIPPDRIGAFSLNYHRGNIGVPRHFMDALWAAAVAADGVLRRVELVIQQHNSEVWNIFEASFTEELAEPFDLPTDKELRPKVGPPRADPVVLELRALGLKARSFPWRAVAVIAAGVLIALWIAKLWR